MKKIICLIVMSSLLFSSCATIFTGRYKQIKFNSMPEGATVSINGVDVGRTPCTVQVRKKLSAQQVQMKLAGYQTRDFLLEKSAANIVWLDAAGLVLFVVPGIIFACVDLATGAAVDFDRALYEIELEKK